MGHLKRNRTTDIAVTALTAALIFVVTWTVRIPIPFASGGGYLNMGDVMIYLCAYLLGGPRAAIAAAVGSGLADLTAGAAIYILPTCIIKGSMGFAAGAISKGRGFRHYLLSAVVGGAIMVVGYASFEYFFFNPAYAFASIPFNTIQWGGCAVITAAVYTMAKKINAYLIRQSSI
ncbi:MAG: ECF transporter S component [Clostridiales Family XIII bacterium]|jgi:uncharacterized membrane protein|nr:ECF transporter S component [Clostridiales Family XIII bacterium]